MAANPDCPTCKGDWIACGYVPYCSHRHLVAPGMVYAHTGYRDDEPAPLAKQEGGSHYTKYSIQPIEYSMANGLDACQHSIVKYVTRFRDKGGLEDLAKARHFLDLLEHFERNKRNEQDSKETA